MASPFEILLSRPPRQHQHRIQYTYNQRPFPIQCNTYTNTRLPFYSTLFDTARRSYSTTSNINRNTRGGTYDCITLYDSLSTTYKQVPLAIQSTQQHDPNRSTRNQSNSETEKRGSAVKGLAWYTCGPTVYDSAHLGHARTYVTLDILHRIILHHHRARKLITSGKNNLSMPPTPMFIMNITDVDDKILTRAKERNVSPLSLAKHYEAEFWKDMEALNVMRPSLVVRVTDHVEDAIIPYIERILDNGMAYILPEGDNDGGGREGQFGSVYFDVRRFESSKGTINKYGKLAPTTSSSPAQDDTFFEWTNDGHNNTTATNDNIKKNTKRDPRDFVLWKSRLDGQEEMSWNSPWGHGRPGWHIECSAMIESISREFPSHSVQIHAGGVDLKFPHHTNEIAQAEAYHYNTTENNPGSKEKKEWIPHWVHTGHLHIQGMKMSKSLKNFITIRDLLDRGHDSDINNGGKEQISYSPPMESPADDFRLWCLGLSGSYRGPATYSEARLEEAKITRQKILRFLMDGEGWIEASMKVNQCPPSKWGEEEHQLIQALNRHSSKCDCAILGRSDQEGNATSGPGFDLDGSSFLQGMLSMTEDGSRYVQGTTPGRHPIEALRRVLSTVRENLSLVGFSSRTVDAGRKTNNLLLGDEDDGVNGAGCGKNAGLVMDELVQFRSKVREAALDILQRKNNDDVGFREKDAAKKILSICDDLRDGTLPEIGFEINDEGQESKWRMCLPQKREVDDKSDHGTSQKGEGKSSSMRDVDVNKMFTVGIYEGTFLHYDEDGIPTHNADGSEVSKRLRKKLTKKMIKRKRSKEDD